MTIVNVLNKLSMTTATVVFSFISIIAVTQSATATTLFNNRNDFEKELSTFIVDDYENPAYQIGDQTNEKTMAIHSDVSMSRVLGETKYTSTGFNNWNIIMYSSVNSSYCAGCNGSFSLDFTETTIGNALGVFGAGFDILTSTNYFAHVTFGDNSTQDFSLAGQNFWGLTSEKSIKTLYLGVENGLSTISGSILIDNLTIGAKIQDLTIEAKSVPEPGSLMAILGLCAFGVTCLSKHEQAKAFKE